MDRHGSFGRVGSSIEVSAPVRTPQLQHDFLQREVAGIGDVFSWVAIEADHERHIQGDGEALERLDGEPALTSFRAAHDLRTNVGASAHLCLAPSAPSTHRLQLATDVRASFGRTSFSLDRDCTAPHALGRRDSWGHRRPGLP